MKLNHRRTIGAKEYPTLSVPKRWIENNSIRMTTEMATTVSAKINVSSHDEYNIIRSYLYIRYCLNDLSWSYIAKVQPRTWKSKLTWVWQTVVPWLKLFAASLMPLTADKTVKQTYSALQLEQQTKARRFRIIYLQPEFTYKLHLCWELLNELDPKWWFARHGTLKRLNMWICWLISWS